LCFINHFIFIVMGVIKRGILGGFSGKVGSITGTSWKGIEVMKSRPLSVANPRTAGQVAQRTKLSNVVAFATAINADVIKPLWDRFAVKASGYNDFVSANIALFATEFPSPLQNLVMSRGKMQATPIGNITCSAGDLLATISWVDDSGEGFKLATDVPYVVIAQLGEGLVIGATAPVQRSSGSIDISLPSAIIGDQLAVYLAFRRADGTIVSNSSYKAGVVVA
jgi:hypothetical protein